MRLRVETRFGEEVHEAKLMKTGLLMLDNGMVFDLDDERFVTAVLRVTTNERVALAKAGFGMLAQTAVTEAQ